MTVSGGWRAADDRTGIKRGWALTTASGHQATEGHTQCVVAGIKQLAAGAVWQVLNNGRRAAGGGMVQTMSCRQQAASGKQQAAGSKGRQGDDNGWPIDCLAIGWHHCYCVVGLPETAAVGICADVLDVGEGIAGKTEIKLMNEEIKIIRI
jgi:hypothetical protein